MSRQGLRSYKKTRKQAPGLGVDWPLAPQGRLAREVCAVLGLYSIKGLAISSQQEKHDALL